MFSLAKIFDVFVCQFIYLSHVWFMNFHNSLSRAKKHKIEMRLPFDWQTIMSSLSKQKKKELQFERVLPFSTEIEVNDCVEKERDVTRELNGSFAVIHHILEQSLFGACFFFYFSISSNLAYARAHMSDRLWNTVLCVHMTIEYFCRISRKAINSTTSFHAKGVDFMTWQPINKLISSWMCRISVWSFSFFFFTVGFFVCMRAHKMRSIAMQNEVNQRRTKNKREWWRATERME